MAAYICYCQKLALMCINSTIFCTDFSTLWDGDCQLGANCISKTVHLNKKKKNVTQDSVMENKLHPWVHVLCASHGGLVF